MTYEAQRGERFDVVPQRALKPATGFSRYLQIGAMFSPSVLFTGILIYSVIAGDFSPAGFWFWFYIAFIGMWFVIARAGLADLNKKREIYAEVQTDGIVLSLGGNLMNIPYRSITSIEARDEYTTKEKIHETLWTGRADVSGPHVAIWRTPRSGIGRLFRGTGEVVRIEMPDETSFVRAANEKLAAYRAEHVSIRH